MNQQKPPQNWMDVINEACNRIQAAGFDPGDFAFSPVGGYGIDGVLTVICNLTKTQRCYFTHRIPNQLSWQDALIAEIKRGVFYTPQPHIDGMLTVQTEYMRLEHDRRMRSWEKRHDSRIEFSNKVFDASSNFASSYIKMLAILHGGAIIAVLSFIHVLLQKDKPIEALASSISWFVVGLLLMFVAAGCAYFSQLFYQGKSVRIGDRFRYIGIAGAIFSTICFGLGANSAICSALGKEPLMERLLALLPFLCHFPGFI